MKAISLWQPWATLCVIGAKQYETRDWATTYRGRILIHAAKNTTERDIFREPEFKEALVAAGYPSFEWIPFGSIIGAVTIAGMRRTEEAVSKISETEECFGNYGPNRWAWALMHPVLLKTPIPCRGMQKIFTVPDDVAAQIREVRT